MTAHDPLDDVAFLARSAHRVTVLQTLADGPRSRRDLHEETGVPQPTLGRVLGAFEERNWVERRGRTYACTAFGDLVCTSLADLLETVETVQRFRDVAGTLPTEELDLDLRALADATVTTPTDGDPLAHVNRLSDVWYSADRGVILMHLIPPGSLQDHEARADRFGETEQVVESINSAESLDQILENPAYVELLREGLENDRIRIHRYEGTIPFVLGWADDTAFIAPTDDRGMPTAFVETTDEEVRAWVEARLDAYREQSTRLLPEHLPEAPATDGGDDS